MLPPATRAGTGLAAATKDTCRPKLNVSPPESGWLDSYSTLCVCRGGRLAFAPPHPLALAVKHARFLTPTLPYDSLYDDWMNVLM